MSPHVIASFCMFFPYFSDNFSRKCCLMSSLLMWCSYYHEGKQFFILLTKLRMSTCTFLFQNYLSHYVVGRRFFYLAPIVKNMQFLTTSPYYNPATYNSCELLRNIYTDCITSHNHKEDIHKTPSKLVTSQISTGLSLKLVLTKDMARVMATFSSRAELRLGKYL